MVSYETVVRSATKDDLAAIKKVELRCGLSSWDKDDYELFLKPAYGVLVVGECKGKVVAFISARLITKPDMARHSAGSTELEICNIGVVPKLRRQDIGKRLAEFLIRSSPRPLSIFLEVRESNFKAIRFYEKLGFEIAAKRKGYYRSPPENALVMKLEVNLSENIT